jgi:hypothetical protein
LFSLEWENLDLVKKLWFDFCGDATVMWDTIVGSILLVSAFNFVVILLRDRWKIRPPELPDWVAPVFLWLNGLFVPFLGIWLLSVVPAKWLLA